jgi:signal transduction histidine kinase
MDLGALLFIAGATLGFAAAFGLYWLKERGRKRGQEQRRKDQFITLASHYLLTPVALIQTALSNLQDKPQAKLEDRRSWLEAIDRGRQRLWIIVQQMITVGEVDASTLLLHEQVTNVADIVTKALTQVDTFARAKGITMQLHDQLTERRELSVDSRYMIQAVVAVLDNAVKFSLEGGVVQVTIVRDKELLIVRVEDDGIGMPERVMRHVTEPFYRGTDNYQFDYEGIGLGLHIAHAIIRAHQGNISFESRPSGGTTVSIFLPF